jgi:hypothetical protein
MSQVWQRNLVERENMKTILYYLFLGLATGFIIGRATLVHEAAQYDCRHFEDGSAMCVKGSQAVQRGVQTHKAIPIQET